MARTTPTQENSGPWWKAYWPLRNWGDLASALAVITAVGALLAGLGRLGDSNALAAVDITSPRDGEEVSEQITLRGTVSGLDDGQEIWMVGIPPGDTRLYPQDGPAVVRLDGTWNSPAVYVMTGIGSDIEKSFEYLAVVANGEAGNRFRQYRRDFYELGVNSGLVELPVGAREYDRITVVRRP